jgi:hypothetical protein
MVYDGVGMWCSSAATRARGVTPLRLARVPKLEHAGCGSSFPLTGSGPRGGPRGVWSPRSAPLPHRGDWPSRTDVGLLPRSCRPPPSWDRSEPFLATFVGPPGLPVVGPRRVVRPGAAARPLPSRSGRVIWSRVAFREVAVIEIRKAALLAGRAGAAHGGRAGGGGSQDRVGMSRPRWPPGWSATAARGQLSDELLGAVVAAVRPARRSGHGQGCARCWSRSADTGLHRARQAGVDQ